MHESTKELHRSWQSSLLQRDQVMLNDRENILSALREKPLKVYEIMKRANVVNEEACQSLLLKMRDEGLVKFDIHKGRWLVG
jgi:DNA-binding IclR family transcriptional regulator